MSAQERQNHCQPKCAETETFNKREYAVAMSLELLKLNFLKKLIEPLLLLRREYKFYASVFEVAELMIKIQRLRAKFVE